jgi:hypothetical protein
VRGKWDIVVLLILGIQVVCRTRAAILSSSFASLLIMLQAQPTLADLAIVLFDF